MKPWRELSKAIALKGNLSCSFRSPGRHKSDSDSDFKEKVELHNKQKISLYESVGVRTEKQVRAKIEELRMKIDKLWRICRPDLYGSGVWK